MIPVLLTRVKTRDSITLEGIVAPRRRRRRTAIVVVHGLASRFSSGQPLIAEFVRYAGESGIGYFKFNTRGHDKISDRHGRSFLGAAFEHFEDCIHDIRAIIRLAQRLGYKNIILLGHSTGANKSLYYMAKTGDRSVRGLILAGPLSDFAAMHKHIGRRSLDRALRHAERLRRKDRNALMPHRYGIYTAERYLSLYRPGSPEDTFPYYRSGARWTALRKVRIPTAVIVGSRDQNLDRPIQELITAFRTNARSGTPITGIIVRGARHSFRNKERELVRVVSRWIQKQNVP